MIVLFAALALATLPSDFDDCLDDIQSLTYYSHITPQEPLNFLLTEDRDFVCFSTPNNFLIEEKNVTLYKAKEGASVSEVYQNVLGVYGDGSTTYYKIQKAVPLDLEADFIFYMYILPDFAYQRGWEIRQDYYLIFDNYNDNVTSKYVFRNGEIYYEGEDRCSRFTSRIDVPVIIGKEGVHVSATNNSVDTRLISYYDYNESTGYTFSDRGIVSFLSMYDMELDDIDYPIYTSSRIEVTNVINPYFSKKNLYLRSGEIIYHDSEDEDVDVCLNEKPGSPPPEFDICGDSIFSIDSGSGAQKFIFTADINYICFKTNDIFLIEGRGVDVYRGFEHDESATVYKNVLAMNGMEGAYYKLLCPIITDPKEYYEVNIYVLNLNREYNHFFILGDFDDNVSTGLGTIDSPLIDVIVAGPVNCSVGLTFAEIQLDVLYDVEEWEGFDYEWNYVFKFNQSIQFMCWPLGDLDPSYYNVKVTGTSKAFEGNVFYLSGEYYPYAKEDLQTDTETTQTSTESTQTSTQNTQTNTQTTRSSNGPGQANQEGADSGKLTGKEVAIISVVIIAVVVVIIVLVYILVIRKKNRDDDHEIDITQDANMEI